MHTQKSSFGVWCKVILNNIVSHKHCRFSRAPHVDTLFNVGLQKLKGENTSCPPLPRTHHASIEAYFFCQMSANNPKFELLIDLKNYDCTQFFIYLLNWNFTSVPCVYFVQCWNIETTIHNLKSESRSIWNFHNNFWVNMFCPIQYAFTPKEMLEWQSKQTSTWGENRVGSSIYYIDMNGFVYHQRATQWPYTRRPVP